MTKIFAIEGTAPWGAYGRVLVHGLTGAARGDGRVALERTGPHVPAYTMPAQALLVTEAGRVAIEKAKLTGAMFVPVMKARIVRYDWSGWDLAAPGPPEIPKGGKAEDYVRSRPHDAALAAEMPRMFQLSPSGRARASIVDVPIGTGKRMIVDPVTNTAKDVPAIERTRFLEVTDGSDFVTSSPVGHPLFVSERARALLGEEFLRYEAYEG